MDPQGFADLERSLNTGARCRPAGACRSRLYQSRHHGDPPARFRRRQSISASGLAYCEEHELVSWIRYMTAARSVTHLRARPAGIEATEEALAVSSNPCVAPISKIQALMVIGLVRARAAIRMPIRRSARRWISPCPPAKCNASGRSSPPARKLPGSRAALSDTCR